MATGAAELRRLRHSLVVELEAGDWPGALELIRTQEAAGSEDLVRHISAVRSLTRAMQRRAQGRLDEAGDLLDDATAQLPRNLRGTSRTGRRLAIFSLEPPEQDTDAHMVWCLARLIWRDQFELDDFCQRLAPGRVPAREVLVEAFVEYMVLIEFDRFVCRPRRKRTRNRDDALPVEPSRKALCDRATALRRLADPAGCGVSQSVWRDVGGLWGLRAEALGALAKRPAPARWCGEEKAAGLGVREGYEWAWKFARRWGGH